MYCTLYSTHMYNVYTVNTYNYYTQLKNRCRNLGQGAQISSGSSLKNVKDPIEAFMQVSVSYLMTFFNGNQKFSKLLLCPKSCRSLGKGRNKVLNFLSPCPVRSLTTHSLPWALHTGPMGSSVHTHTFSGHLILPPTDLERLSFGCHSKACWQMVSQPQAQHQPLLKKSSPGIPPLHSLEDAHQAGPICSHCFPGTVYLGFTEGYHVPRGIFPDYIAYAHFLPWLSLEQMFQYLLHLRRTSHSHHPIHQIMFQLNHFSASLSVTMTVLLPLPPKAKPTT
jgi:hypothetical protein